MLCYPLPSLLHSESRRAPWRSWPPSSRPPRTPGIHSSSPPALSIATGASPRPRLRLPRRRRRPGWTSRRCGPPSIRCEKLKRNEGDVEVNGAELADDDEFELQKDSNEAKRTLDELKELGWAKRWSSQPYMSRRTVSDCSAFSASASITSNLDSVARSVSCLIDQCGCSSCMGVLDS